MQFRWTRSIPTPSLWLAFVALLATAGLADAQPLPVGPTHRGIVTVGAYQIFPENRPGNGVYQDNVLLLSLPGQTLQDVGTLPPKGRFTYLARQGDARTVGLRNGAGDPAPRVTEVSPGYFYIVAMLDGAAYKKLYRVRGAGLVDLLPSSKTADGIAVGEKGVLFYHIGKAEQPEGGVPSFSIGIHLAILGEERVRHLGQPVINALPSLSFKWLDESRFQYTLVGGKTEVHSISDFR